MFVKGLVSEDSFSGGLRVRGSEVMTVQELRNRSARSLRIDVGGGKKSRCSVDDLRSILSDYRSNSEILRNFRDYRPTNISKPREISEIKSQTSKS